MTAREHSALAVVLSILSATVLVCGAIAFGADAATLTWQDNATNEAGYKIERQAVACTAPDAFTPLAEVGANVAIYTDATTQDGKRYCYRIRAWNLRFADDPESAQFSAYSNEALIEYPFAVPAAPSGLSVSAP